MGFKTIDETADFFGLSPWSIRAMVRTKKLASVKVGRRRLIETAEIERFINQCKTEESAGECETDTGSGEKND